MKVIKNKGLFAMLGENEKIPVDGDGWFLIQFQPHGEQGLYGKVLVVALRIRFRNARHGIVA